jgi:hypothetical protein
LSRGANERTMPKARNLMRNKGLTRGPVVACTGGVVIKLV